MDRERIAGGIQNRTQVRPGVRPVDIVLRVFFARADELDRTSDRLGGVNRLHHEVGNDLAAEAAAQERDVDGDLVGRASERLGDGILTGRDRLDRSPDLDRAVVVAGGSVARLVRRMRDVRQLEPPLDNRCRVLLQDFSRLAVHESGDAVVGV